ncbi:MAG: MFS transporter [Lactobacillus sp.]|nr:MFS transporter [Lactobacillus sp.]
MKARREIALHWILFGQLVVWIGSSFIWPLTSVYLHKELHISLAVIGLILFGNCTAAMIASMISGRLFDKYDPYPLIVAGAVFNFAVMTFMIFEHGWPSYAVLLILLGFGGGWNGSLMNSIATSLKRHPSRYVFNMIYFAQNLGVVLGTFLVGILYDFSLIFLFVVAATLYFLGMLTVIFCYKPIRIFHQERKQKVHKENIAKSEMPKPNFLLAFGLYFALGVTWLMYMNWESNLSVYMVSLGIPFHQYSLLWTLNAMIIVIVQAVLAKFPHIFRQLYHQIYFGLAMFAISFVILLYAKTFSMFAVAMAVLTLGEATAFPAIPALVNEITPLSEKGKYQGASIVASSIGRAVGPMIGGLLIEEIGYEALFIFAAIGIFLMILMLIPLHHAVGPKLKWFKE